MLPQRRPHSTSAFLALALATTLLVPLGAQAADQLLAGSVKSAANEALGGVTVSAKAEGHWRTKGKAREDCRLGRAFARPNSCSVQRATMLLGLARARHQPTASGAVGSAPTAMRGSF
jgi:hypothetical protein